jgi:hypothetical protein
MEIKNKPRRFFFHYNKPESRKQGRNVLTVHWQNACIPVNHLKVNVPIESHKQKHQPQCVMRGFANSVEIIEENNEKTALIA